MSLSQPLNVDIVIVQTSSSLTHSIFTRVLFIAPLAVPLLLVSLAR
jgi:hypothetical protein